MYTVIGEITTTVIRKENLNIVYRTFTHSIMQ